jgi:hypothetical protein
MAAQPYFAKALFEYVAVEDTELSINKGARISAWISYTRSRLIRLPAGDFLTVEETNDSGWCLAKLGDRAGWVPADYIEKVREELPRIGIVILAAPACDTCADPG